MRTGTAQSRVGLPAFPSFSCSASLLPATFSSFSIPASSSSTTPAQNMANRVAVVTGSNKGIGLAIVRALCQQFPGDVYVTARDVGRGQEAVASLVSEGLKPKFHQLDINDLNSITTAADYFKEKYGGVDVLVNNAGIAFKVADTTPFAVQAEVTLKTNFFATRDMLTHFLPIIKAGGRVVNVSSFVGSRTLNQCSLALQQRFRSEDITEDELVGLMQQFVDETKKEQHKQGGWPETAYGVSKMGLTTLSMILARRLSKERPNDGILLNACCPGWVRTDMAGPKAPKSPDEGAVTPAYLALMPPGATEPHGKFVSEKEVQSW
ncbi:carbonyl reductase [NADPH] 1 isoform X1 [Mastacembelus armatus]|nr:carbonyl reductase [NADPH] 1 isoform X1 [Mastacembelus armatus]